jgi:transposase
MNDKLDSVERVIGLDAHPDSFTAAVLRGPTPAAAVVEKIFNKVPMGQLQSWAKKHTTAQDQFVLEASGNSFQVVRTLVCVERQAKVLESCQLGKLKEAHANNDKISAVRIGKAYLAGTAKEVWVPDTQTQDRRDLFHAHRKAVKRTTQMNARVRSYLSDNGVRLKRGTRLTAPSQVEEQVRTARDWSARQWQVLEGLLLELRHAEQQRRHWRGLIAQEVLTDASLLELMRLCGVREMVAFALAAFIGDIKRFAHPKQLVKYVGLNPAFDDSGASQWSGGIGGHGNKHLRCLLVEGAQALLRCAQTPLAHWGKKLLARKGSVNLAVAAMARKLTVAVWYLMRGQWTPLEEIDERLEIKLTKVIGRVGQETLDKLGQTRGRLREQARALLQARAVPTGQDSARLKAVAKTDPAPEAKIYILDPSKKFAPKPKADSLAAEYGVVAV